MKWHLYTGMKFISCHRKFRYAWPTIKYPLLGMTGYPVSGRIENSGRMFVLIPNLNIKFKICIQPYANQAGERHNFSLWLSPQAILRKNMGRANSFRGFATLAHFLQIHRMAG